MCMEPSDNEPLCGGTGVAGIPSYLCVHFYLILKYPSFDIKAQDTASKKHLQVALFFRCHGIV